jgi:hypothetical protein
MNFEVVIDEPRIDVMNMFKKIVIIEILAFEVMSARRIVVDTKQVMSGQKTTI